MPVFGSYLVRQVCTSVEVVGTQSLPVLGSYLVVQDVVGVVLVTVFVFVLFRVESFFLVSAPTNPVPVVSPAGVSVSCLYLFWKLITALCVAGPKYVVSLFGEPAPLTAICVSGSWFRSIWRFFTSSPLLPSLRLEGKTYAEAVVVKANASNTNMSIFFITEYYTLAES